MPGSGKSIAAEAIEKMGFKKIEMGDIVRDKLKRKNIEVTNQSLREFALQIRKQYGKDIVAKWTTKYIGSRRGNLLIVGIRNSEELDYFSCKN